MKLLVLFVALLTGAWQQPVPPERPTPNPVVGARILGGTTMDGKLWLWGAGGALGSFDLDGKNGARATPRTVYGVRKVDGALWMASREAGREGELTVLSLKGGKFTELPRLTLPADQSAVLLMDGSQPLIMTPSRLYRLNRNRWTSVDLKQVGEGRSPVEFGAMSVAVPRGGGFAYLGLNSGEWGGSLRRLNLRTGEYSYITDATSSLDPVTGLVPDPARPECVVGSFGVSHMGLMRGSLRRICGTEVETLLTHLTPAGEGLFASMRKSDPFFGIATGARGDIWGVTPFGLHRVNGQAHETMAMPRLELVDGLPISRALPGVILLATDLNAGMSLSGYTPLVVPIEG